MKTGYLLKILSALVVLLIAGLPAHAFMPTYYPVPGEYHKLMTLEALDQIYATYGYGPTDTLGITHSSSLKPYTDSMENARERIAQSSADTDSKNSGLDNKPEYHCDDEQLNECSNTVKSETDKGVDNIQKGAYDSAHRVIGHVVHTLQDFYAHSNWIEMNGATVDPEMGYGNLNPSSLAAPNENTCTNLDTIDQLMAAGAGASQLCNAMNPNNIITHHLTSGYYGGEGIAPRPGINKCFHGGAFDGYGPQGINKDAAVCNWAGLVIAPHAALNGQAVAAAKAATVAYFNNIKSRVSEADFKQFLGFGAPSLGFAIDTTSSMTQEIDGVKSTVKSIVTNRLGTGDEPANYVLGIINDPTVPQAMKTTDASTFLNQLSL